MMYRYFLSKYNGVLFILLLLGTTVFAETDRAPNNNNSAVSVNLDYRVIIPKIIYFRLGSETIGTIDKVTIDLNQSPQFTNGTNTYNGGSNPLGNSTEIAATDNGDLIVDIRGNVGDITITYEVDNVLGLSNGSGQFISFDQIKIVSSDPTNFPSPILENNGGSAGLGESVTITGNLFNGRVVNRQAVWTYSYLNEVPVRAGTYEGRVTYTASVP